MCPRYTQDVRKVPVPNEHNGYNKCDSIRKAYTVLALHVLASGSKGNAAIVENLDSGEGILVDCGICKRDFLKRSSEAGFDIAKLKAILITHDHSDHVKGLGVVMRGLPDIDYDVYALKDVARSCQHVRKAGEYASLIEMSIGDEMHIAGIDVNVFETSHDAIASCGFRFEKDSDSIGFMTDTGYVTDAALKNLASVRILAIESNHDSKMLESGEYPYHLKKRIASDRGHLSNGQTSDAIRLLNHDRLEHIVAMHISHNNNLPSIVKEELEAVLKDAKSGAQLHISSQSRLVSIH